MPSIKCPQCGTVIEAPAGGTARCPTCGFAASVAWTSPPAPTGAPGASSGQVPAAAPTFAAPPGQVPEGQVLGKPRRFWTSFFLGIITIGIYWLVWNYKSFRELDRQHGQSHEELWYWLGIVFIFLPLPFLTTIFYLVYGAKEIGKLETYRSQRGLPSGISPGLFIALFLLGIITLGITTIIGYHKLSRSQNEVWANAYMRAGRPWPFM